MEASSSAYTCITCRVAFPDAELQRAHYKTDWHRYNLKRKVSDLPSVTSENFQHRLESQKAMFSFQEDENKLDKSSTCHACSKHFRNKNQYENHIKSRKHLENEKKHEANKDKNENKMSEARKRTTSGSDGNDAKKFKEEEEMEASDDDSDASFEDWEGDCLGIEECLFCSHLSSSLETNMKHMTVKHSFFIPDAEYLVNLEELITYFGEKIGAGHMCLWCNEKGKAFPSAKATQQHMVDKGHCKIMYEARTMTEFVDYYDYRSSYPDYKDKETDKDSATKEGATKEGATADDVEMKDSKDDEEVDVFELVPEGYEMSLPSGATIGHRSLMKYYKQNLPQKKRENQSKSILPGMLAQYKALGWTGATGAVAEQRVKDLGYMQRMKKKYHQQLGSKSNKLQKYFRKQVLV